MVRRYRRSLLLLALFFVVTLGQSIFALIPITQKSIVYAEAPFFVPGSDGKQINVDGVIFSLMSPDSIGTEPNYVIYTAPPQDKDGYRGGAVIQIVSDLGETGLGSFLPSERGYEGWFYKIRDPNEGESPPDLSPFLTMSVAESGMGPVSLLDWIDMDSTRRIPINQNGADSPVDINDPAAGPTTDSDEVEEDDGEPTCESESGSLGWIACPGVNLMLGAVESIAKIMGELLTINPIQAENDNAVFEIWKSLRTVSLVVLVIAALIAVFGQAAFINMDAYTFKKMVPRLAIGAIGITLSFYICMLLIDFFNVFGRGMFDLIEKSAGSIEFETNTSSGIAALLIGAMAAGGAYLLIAGPATIATLLGVLLPVVLAFITALAIIMLRHVLVIVLVAISPLAIACWILPNTESYFKRWWGLFSTVLMMYPLIMIMLAAGNVVAVMLVNDGGKITESNFINFLLALLALGATMAAIPFTIKASGGVLTRLAGAMNNPNKGPIDRLRKGIDARKQYGSEERKRERLERLGRTNVAQGGVVGSLRSGNRMNTLRRGWLKSRTGNVGYGRNYSDLHEAESTRGAMTTEMKLHNLEQEQEDREYKIATAEHSRNQTDPDTALGVMTNPQSSRAQIRAAGDRLVALQSTNQLTHGLNTLASSPDPQRQQLANEIVGRNFGNINEFAPQITGQVKGTGLQDFQSVINRPADTIGAVNMDSVRALMAGGTAAQKNQFMVRYIQARRTNQRINPEVANFLQGLAGTAAASTGGRTATFHPPVPYGSPVGTPPPPPVLIDVDPTMHADLNNLVN